VLTFDPNLFQGLQSLMGNKPDSAMKIDPDGKRLQIDDLIIIPNNLHSPPEGGSALKSLAQIASRYQSGSAGQPADASSPKKARMDEGKVALPDTSPAVSALGASLHQQSLFSVFPPGLIPGTWPPTSASPGSKAPPTAANSATSTKLSSATAMNSALALAAAAAAAGLSNFPLSQDLSKLGPDSYAQLIQLYEKHLKSATGPATPPTPPSAVKAPASTVNGSSKKDAAGAASAAAAAPSAKDKDRQKVSKPPPETKRPPRLMQTPCAFVQTNHIYTNPMIELTKAKEAVAAAAAATAARDKLPVGAGTIETPTTRTLTTSILDLSSQRRTPKPESQSPAPGLLNLKKESALLANPHSSASTVNLMGPSMKRENAAMSHPLSFSGSASVLKHELKSSPFSAESLLSKSSSSTPSKTSAGFGLQHSMSDLVKLSGDRGKQDSRLSPAAPLASMASLPRSSPAPGSSPFASSHSPLSTGPDKSRSSPWHVPVSQTSGGSVGQKPAIPVSPVIRESDAAKKDSLSSFQSALLGLSAYPSTTTSGGGATPLSMSLPPTSFPSLSPSAASLSAAQQSFAAAAAANPYLALMSMGGGLPPSSSASSAMSKSLAASFSPHLMDPATSAYYAALYSQQMYGLSPYMGLGAGIRPGMPSPSPSPGSSQAAASALAAAAAAGLDPLQASALQAMLSRGSGSAASPTSPFPGFPAGLTGFPGYPSFPPQSGRKDS
jgi:hypothetical protein